MEIPEPKHELPDAFSLFKPSWEAFKFNFEPFVWQLLLPTALIGFSVFAGALALAANNAVIFGIAAAFVLAMVCLSIVVTMALIKTQIASVRGQHIRFRQSLRATTGYVWRLIGLFIVCALILVIGFLLLVVPGLFAMQRLLLAPYFLVDQNLGIRESIRRSWRAGKQFSGPLWGVVGIIIGINFVSWIPVVGWVVSLGLSIMYLNAPALRYIQVTKKHDSAPIEA